MNLEKLAIQGRPKVYSSMAASISSKLVEMRNGNLRSSFEDFFNQEHRLEFVASVHNIDFINDSRAETVNATWYALEDMLKPTVWLIEGDGASCDYSKLHDIVKKKVKAIICVGSRNRKAEQAFGDIMDIMYVASSMEDAVFKAFNLCDSGDAVLLSPTSTPNDVYSDYKERGIAFKKSVNKL
ncbi:MAG: hypothetical protein PHR20_00940 [Bacteroidales bacterium]|nr:hypothetical protein [Bacteroidales bacterium]